MSIEAMTFVKFMDLGDLECPSKRCMMLIIAENTFNDICMCLVGQEEIGRQMRMSDRSVQRHQKDLADGTVIKKHRRTAKCGGRLVDGIEIVGFREWLEAQQKTLPDNLSGSKPVSRQGCRVASRHLVSGSIKDNRINTRTSLPLPQEGSVIECGGFSNLLAELGQESHRVIEHFLDRVVAALKVDHKNPQALFREVCLALKDEPENVLSKAAEVIIQERSVLTAPKNATDAVATAKQLLLDGGNKTSTEITITKDKHPKQWAAWRRVANEDPKAYPALARIMELSSMASVPSDWPPTNEASA